MPENIRFAQPIFFGWHKQTINYRLWLGSSETVSLLRPLALLDANTLRPFFVLILSLKPCLFFLFLLEGWYVLFMAWFFLKDCEGNTYYIQKQNYLTNFYLEFSIPPNVTGFLYRMVSISTPQTSA